MLHTRRNFTTICSVPTFFPQYPLYRFSGYLLPIRLFQKILVRSVAALGRSVPVAQYLTECHLVSLYPRLKIEVEWGYNFFCHIGKPLDRKKEFLQILRQRQTS